MGAGRLRDAQCPPWVLLADFKVAELCLCDPQGQGAWTFHLDEVRGSLSWACFLVSLS